MTEPSRKKVLLVTRNLPPLVGGMERLNWHLIEELSRYSDITVIGPLGSSPLAPKGAVIVEIPHSPLWQFLSNAFRAALRESRRRAFDIVLAGSGLTAPIAWWTAKFRGSRSAVYVHGLDVGTRHPIYKMAWHPAIRRMDRVIANSSPTADICRSIGVNDNKLGIIHPGVAIPESLPSQEDIGAFRRSLGLENRFILLSVGRLSSRKGLREFVANSLPAIVKTRPDTVLLVIGEPPKNSIHAPPQSVESIEQVAAEHGLADNIRFIGVERDFERLRLFYSASDVHVFPVRKLPGDPEGFGMVAVEAAAHGLPTVAFATGGTVDSVSSGQSGRLVPPGNYRQITEAVLEVGSNRDALHYSARSFAEQFSWFNFGRGLKSQLQI